MMFPPERLQTVLTKGTRMLKYPNKASSRPEERLIKVDLMPLQISWESKKKKSNLTTVDFHSIREIRLGQNTKAFDVHGKRGEGDRAFSIIYVVGGRYKMLNLVAPTKEDYELWVSGLYMLMAQEGRLDLDEVTALMKKLNIRLSKVEIKSTFKNANISKLGHITFDAFQRLYSVLRFRPEISELFSSLSKTDTSVITYEEFKNFVFNTQKATWTEERCREVYNKYTPVEGTGQMDMDHFSAFLISANNAIFKKQHTEVFMDMTRPLTEYFIAASHNTYLLENQLTGESSVEGYIRALQRGCRCWIAMMDQTGGLWYIMDGPYVIDAISRYAFVASPYPLTLSLESHCSLEQQVAMANILKDTLKDMLVTKPVGSGAALPSPEDLKGKIMIKGRIGSSEAGKEQDSEDDSDGEEPNTPLLPGSDPVSPGTGTLPRVLPAAVRKILTPLTTSNEEPGSPTSPTSPDEGLLPTVGRKKSVQTLAKQRTKQSGVVARSLAELFVYCKGVRFVDFKTSLDHFKFDYICSLSEKKSLGLIQRQRKEYIEHNATFLTRVYPAGTRITSSNYDPLPHWGVGAQMVAMNYQTFDRGLSLSHAMFTMNGRAGYVLKPQWLRRQTVSGSRAITLSVKVISAQQLPKPKDSDAATSVIDPSVQVEVVGACGPASDFLVSPVRGRGADEDIEPGSASAKFRTKCVNNNGFNPMWQEEFKFIINEPEMAFLRFDVYDTDSFVSDDFLGCYVIPVRSLEEGYRHVPLYNWKGEVIRFSTLFVFVQISPIGGQEIPMGSPRGPTLVPSEVVASGAQVAGVVAGPANVPIATNGEVLKPPSAAGAAGRPPCVEDAARTCPAASFTSENPSTSILVADSLPQDPQVPQPQPQRLQQPSSTSVALPPVPPVPITSDASPPAPSLESLEAQTPPRAPLR
ncbi:1-phosphatidylinositol 4,5-bisphosphate phosphodiesterase delta-4 [Borealophlyctis nickersoniae]|nr:1-phosphatidylinositol 4,5-bisphosphate phosphodiesterase delta-4 [Borealophlyctis nickersoniae]